MTEEDEEDEKALAQLAAVRAALEEEDGQRYARLPGTARTPGPPAAPHGEDILCYP
jgi:hypothetical protein